MGMYTGLRVIGTVKKEFVEDVLRITDYEYTQIINPTLHGLYNNELYPRMSFIPHGVLCSMPDSWHNKEIPTKFSKKTREWSFRCSLKNYDGEIEAFMAVMPIFFEKVTYCEKFYEEWESGELYSLVNEQMKYSGETDDYE